jgi:acetylornithine deacetylase/succinyl-diaminopimelate desuccinylase-like protein
MDTKAIYDKVIGIIDQDRQDLIDLCMLLGNTHDYHGEEMEVAGVAVSWLKENGIQAQVQPITETSANAVGFLPGASNGTSLIFNAHLDAGGPPPPDAPESEWKMRSAWVEGDMLYGKGLINDKAQLCAEMIAARAILNAGIKLQGDLTIVGVASETGEASVDDKQGIQYPGEGFGTKWSIDRGVVADFALVGETSEFGIVAAECGDVRVKVKVKGRRVYTPRLDRGTTLQQNPNPHLRGAHVALALEDWAIRYEKENPLKFYGGTIVPKAQLLGIQSSVDNCYIYLDIRTVPGANPVDLLKQIKGVTRTTGLDCDVDIYQFNRGYIAQNADPLINAVKEAHRYILKSEPLDPPSRVISMWRDLNDYNEVGIPSICYGPGRQTEAMTNAQNRAMLVEDLLTATKVYALTAMRLCGIDQSKGG